MTEHKTPESPAPEPVTVTKWECTADEAADVMRAATWNIGQLVLWAGLREPRAVAHVSGENGPIIAAILTGSRHVSLPSPALSPPEVDQRGDVVHTLPLAAWEKEVWRKLENGLIKATGKPVLPNGENGERRKIKKDEWHDLELSFSVARPSAEIGLYERTGGSIRPRYTDIRINVAHALREFLPVVEASGEAQRPSSAVIAGGETPPEPAQSFVRLPETPPKAAHPKAAHKALLALYPNWNIPRDRWVNSYGGLARKCSVWLTQQSRIEYPVKNVTEDDVKRALGKKK